MATLNDIANRALRELMGNRCNSKAVVNLQNGTATFDSVTEPDAIINGCIAGEAVTVADVTDKVLAALPALQNPVTGQDGYYSQPINTTVYYLWVAIKAGTSYVIQGVYEGQTITDASGKSRVVGALEAARVPDIAVPSLYMPIAAFKVVNGANAVFIPATTFWNATSCLSYASPVNVLGKAVADMTWTAGGS